MFTCLSLFQFLLKAESVCFIAVCEILHSREKSLLIFWRCLVHGNMDRI